MTRLDRTYFERMYANSPDPWGFATRWYERRKYALTLGALPDERYRRAFEPGCSIGVLTAALAPRCDELLAVDLIAAAVEAARARCAALGNVTVQRRSLPEEWPDGSFDLILLCEIGYYYDAAGLGELLDRVVASLEPGGTLVAVHWRPDVPEYPSTGDAVHAAILARPGLERVVAHREELFLLDVFRVRPAGH